MDLQTYLDSEIRASRAKSLSDSDQLTLGELILKLEPIVENQKTRISDGKTEEATVVYDFEYLFPTTIDSWRGSYSELALDFVDSKHGSREKEMKASDFLKMLKETIGEKFTGYKGGEFVMGENTPVWVANYGNSGSTAVIDVVDNGYQIIIITGYRNF